MRFRIPPQHRETVTIVREDAYERSKRETVAEDVVCMINPVTSGIPQRDATQLRAGVGVQQTEAIALLSKPNTGIKKGDFLMRSDFSELRIVDVLQVKGSAVMRLYLRGQGVL
ncbi:hypothetical protein J4G07_22240 [Candidatus Poribacteria bacterium]|nr:hypothetical protein [Candidatus Poribacteria bacterium]